MEATSEVIYVHIDVQVDGVIEAVTVTANPQTTLFGSVRWDEQIGPLEDNPRWRGWVSRG